MILDSLDKYISYNHLSKNIGGTVTNFIYWFDIKNQDLKFEYENGILIGISVLDPKDERILIRINE